MIELPALGLVLIGAAVMLVVPLQRVTVHRSKERTYIAGSLRKSFPALPDGGENDDLLDQLK